MRAGLLRLSSLLLTAFVAASLPSLANAKEPRLETSDAMIPSGDAGIELFVIFTHRANIARMVSGTEHRVRKVWLFRSRSA